MALVKPRVIGGFPEFLPADQIALERAKELIRRSFEHFGFVPIETPAVEPKEIILAKGMRDSKQIYTVSRLQGEQELRNVLADAINAAQNGVLADFLQKYSEDSPKFEAGDTDEAKALKIVGAFTERAQTDMALHFDLTVPLAHFVAKHAQELAFPFRRYQIQKVWRGERHQSGRSREFYQCDIDVIGRGSLDILTDAEIPSIIYRIFTQMGIGDFVIRISNAKILDEYLQYRGVAAEHLLKAKEIVDDMEKVGISRTVSLLSGLLDDSLEDARSIVEFLVADGQSVDQLLETLSSLQISEQFTTGAQELSAVMNGIRMFGVPEDCCKIDLTIARGLDYYTGTVYETVLVNHRGLGSICSGGRYDDLASNYTSEKLPGVGISIGLTRLVSRLLSAGLVPSGPSTVSPVLVTMLDRAYTERYVSIANALRQAGISTELYLEAGALGKQLRYANKKQFILAIVAGEREFGRGLAQIKNLATGGTFEYPIGSLPDNVKYLLGLAEEPAPT